MDFFTRPHTVVHLPRLLGLALLLPGLSPAVCEAKLYKYVDDQGQVHYTDRVPPEHVRRSRVQLDGQGHTVRKVDRAKTADEIARRKELERLRKEQERVLAEQKARDAVLLRTYRGESDILLARDGKIGALETMIRISRNEIERKKRLLTDLQADAAARERAGEKVGKKHEDRIENTRASIAEDYGAILRRESDRELIRNQYAGYLKRFREIKQTNEARPIPEPKRHYQPLVETVVPCADSRTCDRYWLRAQAFVRRQRTTRVQMDSNRIYLTAPAYKEKELSLILSRIPANDKAPERVFMDIQCADIPEGRAYCRSAEVSAIRAAFRPTVLKGG